MMQSPEYREACESTPGCSARQSRDYKSETVWRVRVTRTRDGGYSIEEIEEISVVEGDGVPIGALYGEVALVGLNGNGDPVDGQVLRSASHRQEVPETLEQRHLPVSGPEPDTFGFVRALPGIKTLEVQAQEGQTLASSDVPTLAGNAMLHKQSGSLGARAAWAQEGPFPSLPSSLPPFCSHIIVLQGEEDRYLAGGNQWGAGIRLTAPGPYQLAAMQAALSRMTPLLCQSITRIGVGLVEGSESVGAVNSFGAGDLVMLNVAGVLSEDELEDRLSARYEFEKTMIHEAAHAAETLLTFESDNPGGYMGSWGFPARTLGSRTVENVRLAVGLPQEWERVHRSFRRHGYASDYNRFHFPSDNSAPTWSVRDLVKGGFMSQYSSTNWAEDIAEFVALTYMGQHQEASGMSRADFACLVMQRHDEENLPAEWSAVYTKLLFLRDLGLVRPEDVEWCTGGRIGLRVSDPGFHVWRENRLENAYLNRVKARLGTLASGVKVFEMDAEGEAGFGDGRYPAEVHLRLAIGLPVTDLERVSWPRGTYELGLAGSNNFWIRLDGAEAGNMDAMEGFVLVAESSGTRIVGSVVIQKAMRLQLKPLPLPHVWNPPLVMRFRIDGSGA